MHSKSHSLPSERKSVNFPSGCFSPARFPPATSCKRSAVCVQNVISPWRRRQSYEGWNKNSSEKGDREVVTRATPIAKSREKVNLNGLGFIWYSASIATYALVTNSKRECSQSLRQNLCTGNQSV